MAYTSRGSSGLHYRHSLPRRASDHGQMEVMRDLHEAQDALGAEIVHDAEDVVLHDVETDSPHITYRKGGSSRRVDCDSIVGCDGFHGISKRTVPKDRREEFGRVYPFGWFLTTALHRFPKQTAFDQRIQETELDYIAQSPNARVCLAENDTGLLF